MNVINKLSILTVLVVALPIAAEVRCETTVRVNLEHTPAEWPGSSDCKVTKLWITDQRSAQSNADNPDPEEGLQAVKGAFAPLIGLRGKVDETCRILLEVPYIFTLDYNKNMNRMNALLATLNIAKAEIFGLVASGVEQTPQEVKSRVVGVMAVATCSPFAALEIKRGSATHLFGYTFVGCSALHAGLHFFVPLDIAKAVAMGIPGGFFTLFKEVWRLYFLLEVGFAYAWPSIMPWFFSSQKIAPPLLVYCIGGRPYQIGEVASEYIQKQFLTDRLSTLCEKAFETPAS